MHCIGMVKFTKHRILLWALGISLALHALFAYLAHDVREVHAQEPPRPGKLTLVLRPPATPTPRPTQPPKPVVAAVRARTMPSKVPPRPAHHAKPKVVAVDDLHRTPAAGRPGPSPGPRPPGTGGDGPPVPLATEAPSAPATPSCATPNVAARAVNVVSPSIPGDLATDIESTAEIAVRLDASGRVLGATVYRSAGLFPLDRAALSAARASQYAPQIRGCLPVAGTYLFTVDFQP